MLNYFEMIFAFIGDYHTYDASPSFMKQLSEIAYRNSCICSTLQINNIINGNLSTSYRPQIISVENSVKINFMNDRIEAIFTAKDLEDNLNRDKGNIFLKTLFNDLNSIVGHKSNRIAYINRGYITDTKKPFPFDRSKYLPSEELVEWNHKTVHRTTVELGEKQEVLNVVISSALSEEPFVVNLMNGPKAIPGIRYEIDINSYQLNTEQRFSLSNYEEYVIKLETVYAGIIEETEAGYKND